MIFGAASLLTGLFNYLYHVVLAHVLGPDDYGALTTFLNVTALLALPAPVVTLLYTRLGKRPVFEGRRESYYLWAGGVLLWVVMWGLAMPLGHWFHVPAGLLLVFTVEVVPSLALAANTGILQRARWYAWVGFLSVVNTGFRIVAAMGAAWSHYGLMAVGLLEGIAAWVTWGASRYLVGKVRDTGEASRSSVVVGTAVVGVLDALLAVTDGLMAKSMLSPGRAGLFNGLATIGHTVQFLSGSFGTVMLTAIIAEPTRKNQFLWITVASYAILAAGAQAVFLWKGRLVVQLILGRRFLPIVAWLPYYGWGMIALGFLNIAMLYSVAQKRWQVIATTGAGLVYWVYRLALVGTVGGFVHATTQTMVVTAAVTGATFVFLRWWPGRLKLKPRSPG